MENIELLKKRIAELEKSEKELIDQLAEFRDFVENVSVPLHWVNGSGIVIWVNQAELDMLGYKKEEFVNQHISKFYADKRATEDVLHRLINRETLIDYPAKLLCKDGSVKSVLINSNVYWKENQFVHTRCFTREATSYSFETGRVKEKVSRPEKENTALRNVRERQN